MGRPALLVNATELMRRPGLQRHVEAAITLDELDAADPRLSGDVTVDVLLESTLDDIVVGGAVTVAWADVCCRCLRPLSEPLHIAIQERYAPDDPSGLRPVNPEAFPIANGQIDLAAMVREEVLLGPPDAPLCQPDCPGLCPVCGADLQAGSCDCSTQLRDERWAVLDQLKDD